MKTLQSIINDLGGASRVAKMLGVSRQRPYVWIRPKSKGGFGGRIPIKYVPILLKEAECLSLELKAEDFLNFDP